MFFDAKAKLFLKSKKNRTSSQKKMVIRVKMRVSGNKKVLSVAMKVKMGISGNGRVMDLI